MSLACILLPDILPCSESLLITTREPTIIADIDEDLTLGLTFDQLAHSTANECRPQILADGGRLSRPVGYRPEMLNQDGNMGEIWQKPLDKAGESTPRERHTAQAARFYEDKEGSAERHYIMK